MCWVSDYQRIKVTVQGVQEAFGKLNKMAAQLIVDTLFTLHLDANVGNILKQLAFLGKVRPGFKCTRLRKFRRQKAQ